MGQGSTEPLTEMSTRSVFRLAVTANVPSSPGVVTLMMEAVRSSEISVVTRATRRSITEDGILYSHCRENLKSKINFQNKGYGRGEGCPYRKWTPIVAQRLSSRRPSNCLVIRRSWKKSGFWNLLQVMRVVVFWERES
jgi:hypothetical protein